MIDRSSRFSIGVDLGGTKIDIGLVDELGRIHEHQRIETKAMQGVEAIENNVVECVKRFQEKAGFPLLGVGVGVAGQVDSDTGTVIFAPNLKWHDVPLRESIEQALDLPVRVINDARALTMGEWKYGAGQGYYDILSLFIGTGIGGGIVSGGNLLSGCSNTFGEVGHMTVDFNGPLCTCGKKGCLEAFAGGWGLAERAKEAIQAKGNEGGVKILNLAGNQLEQVNAHHLFQAFREEDPMAEKLIEDMYEALIAGCASLVNVLNPCRLILGGGIVEAMPEIVERVDRGVKSSALKAATKSLEVVKAKLGKELGVLGAAAVIFDLLKGSD